MAAATSAAHLKADFTIRPFQTREARNAARLALLIKTPRRRIQSGKPASQRPMQIAHTTVGPRIAMSGSVLLDCREPFHRNADSTLGGCCLCPAALFSGP